MRHRLRKQAKPRLWRSFQACGVDAKSVFSDYSAWRVRVTVGKPVPPPPRPPSPLPLPWQLKGGEYNSRRYRRCKSQSGRRSPDVSLLCSGSVGVRSFPSMTVACVIVRTPPSAPPRFPTPPDINRYPLDPKKVRHKLDDVFAQPKALCFFELVSPVAYESPRTVAALKLFEMSLDERLNEYTYDAQVRKQNQQTVYVIPGQSQDRTG